MSPPSEFTPSIPSEGPRRVRRTPEAPHNTSNALDSDACPPDAYESLRKALGSQDVESASIEEGQSHDLDLTVSEHVQDPAAEYADKQKGSRGPVIASDAPSPAPDKGRTSTVSAERPYLQNEAASPIAEAARLQEPLPTRPPHQEFADDIAEEPVDTAQPAEADDADSGGRGVAPEEATGSATVPADDPGPGDEDKPKTDWGVQPSRAAFAAPVTDHSTDEASERETVSSRPYSAGPPNYSTDRRDGNDGGRFDIAGSNHFHKGFSGMFSGRESNVPPEDVIEHGPRKEDPRSAAASRAVVGQSDEDTRTPEGPAVHSAPSLPDAAREISREGHDIASPPDVPEPDRKSPLDMQGAMSETVSDREDKHPEARTETALDAAAESESAPETGAQTVLETVGAGGQKASENEREPAAKGIEQAVRESAPPTEERWPSEPKVREVGARFAVLFLSAQISPAPLLSPDVLGVRALSFTAAEKPFSKFVGFVVETTVTACTGNVFAGKSTGVFAEHVVNLLVQEDLAVPADRPRTALAETTLVATAVVDIFQGNLRASAAAQTLSEQYGMEPVDRAFRHGVDRLAPVVNNEVSQAPPPGVRIDKTRTREEFTTQFRVKIERELEVAGLRAVVEQYRRIQSTGCPKAIPCTRERPCIRCRTRRR